MDEFQRGENVRSCKHTFTDERRIPRVPISPKFGILYEPPMDYSRSIALLSKMSLVGVVVLIETGNGLSSFAIGPLQLGQSHLFLIKPLYDNVLTFEEIVQYVAFAGLSSPCQP